jgi:hypothetical protein
MAGSEPQEEPAARAAIDDRLKDSRLESSRLEDSRLKDDRLETASS